MAEQLVPADSIFFERPKASSEEIFDFSRQWLWEFQGLVGNVLDELVFRVCIPRSYAVQQLSLLDAGTS